MSDATQIPVGEQVKQKILQEIPGSKAEVYNNGNHVEIMVIAEQFRGLSRVNQQRLVYSAINEFLAGDNAPVHAVDRLVTKTPN